MVITIGLGNTYNPFFIPQNMPFPKSDMKGSGAQARIFLANDKNVDGTTIEVEVITHPCPHPEGHWFVSGRITEVCRLVCPHPTNTAQAKTSFYAMLFSLRVPVWESFCCGDSSKRGEKSDAVVAIGLERPSKKKEVEGRKKAVERKRTPTHNSKANTFWRWYSILSQKSCSSTFFAQC